MLKFVDCWGRVGAFTFVVACSWAVALEAQPAQTKPVETWDIYQRTHGCVIAKSDFKEPTLEPAYLRQFRGPTLILFKIPMPVGAPLSRGDERGKLQPSNSPGIPVQVRWGSSMDPHKPNWPVERLMSVALEQSALPAFTRALEDNRTLCLVSNQVQVEIAVPKADRWSQTTICLEKVGNQLLTASPKNANGSTANVSRDVPLPRGSGKEWFSVNNYPARARAANIQGDVSVAVSVDKYGYPVGCSVVESSNNKDLDEGACSRLVAVARFFPALEKDGRAVNGVWKTVIRWRL
ncbi:energy transducer TonB (plasmid) [Novosphingobium resinovorum]|jgi:TonB family protein|uniref:energy transducer TonB n=2 Tax=Sphingomonadaceae TaxID=41297 RepID=UPI0009F614AA|nr:MULTISPECIES: energy transducer TonB [Novosphingobium]WJM30355.1 energy transducer TonB [Novosphingobium resinovorum]